MTIIYVILTIAYYATACACFIFNDVIAGILFSASAIIMTGLTIDEIRRRKKK